MKDIWFLSLKMLKLRFSIFRFRFTCKVYHYKKYFLLVIRRQMIKQTTSHATSTVKTCPIPSPTKDSTILQFTPSHKKARSQSSLWQSTKTMNSFKIKDLSKFWTMADTQSNFKVLETSVAPWLQPSCTADTVTMIVFTVFTPPECKVFTPPEPVKRHSSLSVTIKLLH